MTFLCGADDKGVKDVNINVFLDKFHIDAYVFVNINVFLDKFHMDAYVFFTRPNVTFY